MGVAHLSFDTLNVDSKETNARISDSRDQLSKENGARMFRSVSTVDNEGQFYYIKQWGAPLPNSQWKEKIKTKCFKYLCSITAKL